MDQAKSYDVLQLLSTVTSIFHCIILVYKFYPLYIGWMKKNHRRQKKIWLKACTKPVIWWWKLWPGKQRVEERFESTSQNYLIFFHKLYIKFFPTLETLYLSIFFNFYFKNYNCFQLSKNVPWNEVRENALVEVVEAEVG